MSDKYDYRYSVLIFDFVRLFREGWLISKELECLEKDNLSKISILMNI
ncbi:hypothetical protein [Nostoc sp. 106C]